jgi:putative transposase
VLSRLRLNSDQGSEYTAKAFRQACDRLGITQSMGRPGSALDNAVIEAWHSTLEFELRSLEHFTTRAQARARVAAWIQDYNTTRSSPGVLRLSHDVALVRHLPVLATHLHACRARRW